MGVEGAETLAILLEVSGAFAEMRDALDGVNSVAKELQINSSEVRRFFDAISGDLEVLFAAYAGHGNITPTGTLFESAGFLGASIALTR